MRRGYFWPVCKLLKCGKERKVRSFLLAVTPPKQMSNVYNPPNVVVFGQTGVGKSSLINMMVRQEIAKVSSQAAGCTPSIQDYRIKSDAGDTYTFWDTPGLNEAEGGNVPAQEAFKHLYRLVGQCAINIIIYCVRGSRFTDIARVNYDLFYRIICEGNVPIVLVVTGLELENDMDLWWSRNKKTVERMGMTFEGYACVTTTKGPDAIFKEKFRVSGGRVWALLKEHCNPIPWTPGQDWLAELSKRMDAYTKDNSRNDKERKVLPILGHRAQTLSASYPSKSTIASSVCWPLSIEIYLANSFNPQMSSLSSTMLSSSVNQVRARAPW